MQFVAELVDDLARTHALSSEQRSAAAASLQRDFGSLIAAAGAGTRLRPPFSLRTDASHAALASTVTLAFETPDRDGATIGEIGDALERAYEKLPQPTPLTLEPVQWQPAPTRCFLWGVVARFGEADFAAMTRRSAPLAPPNAADEASDPPTPPAERELNRALGYTRTDERALRAKNERLERTLARRTSAARSAELDQIIASTRQTRSSGAPTPTPPAPKRITITSVPRRSIEKKATKAKVRVARDEEPDGGGGGGGGFLAGMRQFAARLLTTRESPYVRDYKKRADLFQRVALDSGNE